MPTVLLLEIVTPLAVITAPGVERVTLPCLGGEIAILPGHAPLIAQLVPGAIVVAEGGRERLLTVGDGLVEVTGSRVSVLTDMAIPADRIDHGIVAEARARARARLQDRIADEEVAVVSASLARSLLRLPMKRRRH